MNRLVTAFALFLLATSAYAEDLHVTLSPVKSTAGQMFYSLYNSEASFKTSDSAYQSGTAAVKMDETKIDLTGLTPGDYAFTAFQDLNNNGILDTNFIGRPTEPFGISNITKTLWSFPNWDDVKFTVTEGAPTSISVMMR